MTGLGFQNNDFEAHLAADVRQGSEMEGGMTRIITVTRFLRAHVLSAISAMRLALLHSCFKSNSEIHLSR